MDIISTNEFNAICHNTHTKVIKFGKVDQPKVFEKNDNTIIKLFYAKKSRLSSDRIWPRALRFYKNVNRLHTYGYDVPIITKMQFCPDLKIYLLYYNKIEGTDVRSLVRTGELHVIPEVAHLVANLHDNGIFFRSIHLENLLYQSRDKFALLDVTDVKFKSTSLSIYLRYRNLKHLLQEPHDKDLLQFFGIKNFMDEYFKSARLSAYSRRILLYLIQRAITTSKAPSQTAFVSRD